MQILTIADLLDGKARAKHPDSEPDLNFKKAKAESSDEQAAPCSEARIVAAR